MKAKNQIVVISGILVLLATATIATSSYVAQPANAQCSSTTVPYGKGCVSQEANPNRNANGGTGQNGFGGAVSSLATGSQNYPGNTGPGIGDIRASGCGAHQFNQPTAHDVC